MSCSKKIKLLSFRVSLSLILSLTAAASLCAGFQIIEDGQYMPSGQNGIEEYEQAGDFAAALKMARRFHEESLMLGLAQDAARLSQTVERLEEKLLTLGASRLLFDEDFQPRIKLQQLLELVDMKPLKKSEKAVQEINSWAQKNLLRQGERWEEQEERFEKIRLKLIPFLRELGFIEGSLPHFSEYQGAIVHGALLSRVRLRLQYLVDQWERGIRFLHLYFLSGERPLEPQYESAEALMTGENSPILISQDWLPPEELPRTECEMMQLVWDQSEIPKAMRESVKIHFINAPMKKDPRTGNLLRPTTDDTVEYWLKEAPPPGRYLAVTNAPYVNRQDIVVRTIAPKQYGFDTVGSGANDQEKISIFLDELARFIFQTKQTAEKSMDK